MTSSRWPLPRYERKEVSRSTSSRQKPTPKLGSGASRARTRWVTANGRLVTGRLIRRLLVPLSKHKEPCHARRQMQGVRCRHRRVRRCGGAHCQEIGAKTQKTHQSRGGRENPAEYQRIHEPVLQN